MNLFRKPRRVRRICQQCKEPVCKRCLGEEVEEEIAQRIEEYKAICETNDLIDEKTMEATLRRMDAKVYRTDIHVLMDVMEKLLCNKC